MEKYKNEQSKSLVELKIKKEVSRKITFFNFFLTVAIVLYHVSGWYNELPMHKTVDLRLFNAFNSIASFMGGVALRSFFLMTGFLLFNNCESTGDMWKKVKSRFKTLGIPFILWNFITMVLYLIRKPGIPIHNMKELIVGFTLVPFDGPLWYIFAVLILLLPSLLVIKLKKHMTLSTYFLILICGLAFEISACNIFPAITSFEYGFWIERFVRNLPLFFLGAYGAMHFSEVILLEKYKTCIIASTFAILFLMAFLLCHSLENRKIIWIIATLSPVFLWFSIYSNIFTKDLGWFFKCNFFIYAMHGPFLLDIIVEKTISYDIGDRILYPIEIVLFKISIFIFIYLISVAIAYLFKKILKEDYFNMLTGGRVN